jgi:hypothetical protein
VCELVEKRLARARVRVHAYARAHTRARLLSPTTHTHYQWSGVCVDTNARARNHQRFERYPKIGVRKPPFEALGPHFWGHFPARAVQPLKLGVKT